MWPLVETQRSYTRCVTDCFGSPVTTADRTAAHRKSDQCRDDPCGGGLHKGCLISAILFPPPRNVYDQSEQHGEEDCLQDKLLSVDVAWHDEERPARIARKPEKTASALAVRRKLIDSMTAKKIARSVRCNCRDSITKRRAS